MPFENEEGDLPKLNITIQFVFLNLNSLYIAPIPSTFQKNYNSPLGKSKGEKNS